MPRNPFMILKNIFIENDGTADYFCQVDPETGKPSGLGVLVNRDGTIREGSFSNGQKMPVYRIISTKGPLVA